MPQIKDHSILRKIIIVWVAVYVAASLHRSVQINPKVQFSKSQTGCGHRGISTHVCCGGAG